MNFQQFLNESEDDFLNEADYGMMAASNQEKMQKVVQRMVVTKEKIQSMSQKAQEYGERSGKTKDDISKAVYQAKIAAANARREAYTQYLAYLQSMQSYYQAKAKEIDARGKSAQRRKG